MRPLDEVGVQGHPDQPDEDVHARQERDLWQDGALRVDELREVGQEEQRRLRVEDRAPVSSRLAWSPPRRCRNRE